MTRDPMTPLWFNFGEYGYPGWCPVTQFECGIMLAGATRLIEQNPRSAVIDMIERTATDLIDQAARGEVTDHWISQAVLIRAMTGLLGYEIPDVMHDWD